MSLFRTLAGTGLGIAALSLALLAAGSRAAADQAGQPKKKKHAVHGVVVGVHHSKNGTGTIIVKVHRSHKGNQTAFAIGRKKKQHLRKFHVTANTTFEKVLHTGMGQNKKEPASFKAVHRGRHVVIVPGGGKHRHAEVVAVVVRAKSK
jgi:hypothetical protein